MHGQQNVKICLSHVELFGIWYTRIMKLYIKQVHGYVGLSDDD